MKKLLTGIVILLLQFNLHSQPDSLKVPFVSYWGLNDSYTFKVTKIKKRWSKGELTKNDSTAYIAQFEVLDSTANSYRIKWSFKNNLTQDYNISPQLATKLAKYDVTEIIYKTTEVGEFVEIENWEEIGEMMKVVFAEILNEKEGIDENMQKNIAPLLKAYSSKEGIAQLIFAELQSFHLLFGVEFLAKDTLEYDDEFPNMFGGNPVKGIGKIFFESVDVDRGHCVLIQEVQMDPEETMEAIIEVFRKMGLKNEEIVEMMKTASMQIRDDNRYEFYYYPGIPIKIEAIRKVEIDVAKVKTEGIQKTIIELVE